MTGGNMARQLNNSSRPEIWLKMRHTCRDSGRMRSDCTGDDKQGAFAKGHTGGNPGRSRAANDTGFAGMG
jgi:hypothetical protein